MSTYTNRHISQYEVKTNTPHDDPASDTVGIETTSGTGFGVTLARALAFTHLSEPEKSMAETVSALSPLTGEPFYEKTAQS